MSLGKKRKEAAETLQDGLPRRQDAKSGSLRPSATRHFGIGTEIFQFITCDRGCLVS